MNDLAISIVIVNWNGRHLLARCLAHLEVAIAATDQVIVVDNGSHDGSVAWLHAEFPWVEVIALPANRGFAGGNNAALADCRHDWILLINNDAFVAPDAIMQLRQVAATCPPTTGAIAATLLFDHAPDLVASSGIVLRRDGVAIDRDMTRPIADIPTNPQAIAGASGGAVLLRRAMIDDIGFFADDFLIISKMSIWRGERCCADGKVSICLLRISVMSIRPPAGKVHRSNNGYWGEIAGVPSSVVYQMNYGGAACLRLSATILPQVSRWHLVASGRGLRDA
jgi:glycosyltransferase involved in cell wall biosynthesis